MKKYTTIIVSFILFLGLQACSKEKQIERSLQKRDGKWNITQLTYESYANGVLIDSYIEYNNGYFIFEKDGSYIWKSNSSFSLDPDGQWTNDASKITLKRNNYNEEYSIVESSKNKMTLRWIDPDVALGEISTEGFVLELERD